MLNTSLIPGHHPGPAIGDRQINMTLTAGVLQLCTRMGAVSVTDAEMLQLALACTGDQGALSRRNFLLPYGV